MIREGHRDVFLYRSNFFAQCIDELSSHYGIEKKEEIDDKSNIEWLRSMA